MIIYKTDKKGFLETLQTNPRSPNWPWTYSSLSSSRLEDVYVSGDDMALCWEADPREGNPLPDLILVSDGQAKDLVAWASVYLTQYRPFTAYCRVLEWPKHLYLLDKKPSIHRSLRSAFVGICIGETLAALNRGDIRKLNPFAVTSAPSFILARNLFVGNHRISEISIERRIDFLRSRFNNFGPIPNTVDFSFLFSILVELNCRMEREPGKNDFGELQRVVLKSCQDIVEYGAISSENWSRIRREFSYLPELDDNWKDSREKRVLAFERISQSIADEKIEKDLVAFVLAYLVTQIAPGSMNHIEMLRSYEKYFPNIAMWYGMCAGLYPDNQVLSFRGGVGLRVSRDLYRNDSIEFKPTHDISFEEIFMLSSSEGREGKPKIDFVLGSPTHIMVEIAPLVETWVSSVSSPTESTEQIATSRIDTRHRVVRSETVTGRDQRIQERNRQTHLFDVERTPSASNQFAEIQDMLKEAIMMLRHMVESEEKSSHEPKLKKGLKKKV